MLSLKAQQLDSNFIEDEFQLTTAKKVQMIQCFFYFKMK